jgi:hypothetical protein
VTRRCESCRQVFTPARSYHRRCWDCWRAGTDQGLRDQGYAKGYAAGYQDARRDQPTMDPDLAREALTLTHPDLHRGAREAKATRVTQQLLALANAKPRVETRSLGR